MGRTQKINYRIDGVNATIDVQTLPAGYYAAKVTFSNGSITQPFLVEH
jgi:hypothetical protein